MAVEVSVKQIALTRDTAPGGFMDRFQIMLTRQAGEVLDTETDATPLHSQRALYARRVVENPVGAATAGGPTIVMGINVVSTTTYDEATKTSVCTIADLDLQSQIATFWNRLGGIDTTA